MFFIMILYGLLSTMNVWVDKVSDIRFSIYDNTYDWLDVFIYGLTCK